MPLIRHTSHYSRVLRIRGLQYYSLILPRLLLVRCLHRRRLHYSLLLLGPILILLLHLRRLDYILLLLRLLRVLLFRGRLGVAGV